MTKLKAQRGIALVVVLVFLVLLSVFIVGFFSNSQDELTAAQSFTGEVSASHLAESAVSVVMGQIREATGRTNGAWGSQPGMIRVYRANDKASDQADAFFKLYSSDDMILSGDEITQWDPAKEVPEGADKGWNHQPAAWTNLNEKVSVVANSVNGKVTYVNRYPILDPTLENKVEGLEFIPDVKTDSEEKARMPVRWLYVLKDGTFTAPSTISNDGLEAKWIDGNRAPSSSNPIVGRVAFWTDDETSKVNVNTAGGYTLKDVADGLRDRAGNTYSADNYPGTFWDAPRAYTRFDHGDVVPGTTSAASGEGEMNTPSLALSQPVRGEYQRYPGHPSTTSLGILFRDLKLGSGASMQDAPYLLTSGQLALLAPRLQFSPDPSKKSERGSNYGIDRLLAAYDSPPGLRVKRLYANVDELFFAQPDPGILNSSSREESDTELKTVKEVLTPDLLEKMRFFLTAYSRAPELNLWGRPRMTIWPVHEVASATEESSLWNASDRLIAFCSTVGPNADEAGGENNVKRFIFQRSDWRTSTTDSAIGRNAKLYTYLRGLTDTPFPGFGGSSFRDKYSKQNANDRDQILTEMLDYIRVVNLRDSTRDKLIVPNLKTTTNINGVSPSQQQFQRMESYRYAPRGLVVPLQFTADGNTTRGFGRFPTISEAAIVLYHAGYKADDGKRYFLQKEMPKGDPSKGIKPVKPVANLVRAFMAFQTFNPMQGFAPITTPSSNSISANQLPTVIEVDNLNQFTVDSQDLGFPATGDSLAKTSFTYSSVDFWNGRNLGGSEGFFHTLCTKASDATFEKNVSPPAVPRLNADIPGNVQFYGLQSIPGRGNLGDLVHPGIELPYKEGVNPKTQMLLGGANLVVRLKFGNVLVSTLNMSFPAASVPIPDGGQSLTPSDDSPYNEMLDTQAYWQDPGGFVPNSPNATGVWASVKEQLAPGGAYTVFPAYVKSFAGRMTWIMNASINPTSKNAESGNYTSASYSNPVDRTNKWRQILQPGDVVRSVTLGNSDMRIACLQSQRLSDPSLFVKHPDYSLLQVNSKPNYQACSLRCGSGTLYFDGKGATQATAFGNITTLANGGLYAPQSAAALALTSVTDTAKYNTTAVKRSDDLNQPGDFDTGLGNLADGPFCNKADEGNLTFRHANYDSTGKTFLYYNYTYPYYDWTYEDTFDTFFTPNRQVPSAVLFGSLLAGRNSSWKTLCFSPNPAGDSHPGRTSPKDYLWLDLFNMPVVEPYAISEPFSTAGKINMNYQIIPFANIKRSSGIRAALQPVRVTAYPSLPSYFYNSSKQLIMKIGIPVVVNGTTVYKPLSDPQIPKNDFRYLVDRDETLKAFEDPTNGFFAKFKTDKSSGFFKSTAQICDFYLYPRQNGNAVVKWTSGEAAMKNWWKQNSLTGDNVREKPYADLYPRLTTKSNTYCVHVRAQALRQSGSGGSYLTWSEKRDRVIGEYRGSSIIERYIDPQDERFTNNTSNGEQTIERIDVDQKSLDTAYRFRVLNTKRFDP